MGIFESRSAKWKSVLRTVLVIALPVAVCAVILFGIRHFSDRTVENEQATLEQALRNSAVHVYALEGRYPESLDRLLEEYHIQYDKEKFVIEYVPNI